MTRDSENPILLNIQWDKHRIDHYVVVIANLINILLALLFVGRLLGVPFLPFAGPVTIFLGVPLTFLVISNFRLRREWWTVVLPLLMVVFLAFELLLDYILEINFRNTWLVGPYLLIYYAACMGMVGYAFLVKVPYGFITLLTYFLQVSLGVYTRIVTGI